MDKVEEDVEDTREDEREEQSRTGQIHYHQRCPCAHAYSFAARRNGARRWRSVLVAAVSLWYALGRFRAYVCHLGRGLCLGALLGDADHTLQCVDEEHCYEAGVSCGSLEVGT